MCAFDDNLIITHVFIQGNTASTPPPQGCAGGGGYWIFSSCSHSFGYIYEAVGISINVWQCDFEVFETHV
jgi:hypothetical protein